MAECGWLITNYSSNYSRQSGLNKSTHLCGRTILKSGYCRRHWLIRARKTYDGLYSQHCYWLSKENASEAAAVKRDMATMRARIDEVDPN